MTSTEIKAFISLIKPKDNMEALSAISLAEIAYQLAVLNERQTEAAPSTLVAEFRKLRDRVEFLESTSEAYSEREAKRSWFPIHGTANETPQAPKPAPEAK